VTLAHELCHLLLDGGHALSAIEVLKARMPAGVEQRAKSFAGELLLPTQVANQHWHEAGRPSDQNALNGLVENLVETYQVTRSVAAWKVEHAASEHGLDLSAVLNLVAPRR
jgi:Zn-dependent peptidase ImmA (M78 family)